MSDTKVTKVTTYDPVGKCECNSTEFYVAGMVKSHAAVWLHPNGNLNIDSSDFKLNAEETEVDLETAADLLGTQDYLRLPEEVLTKIHNGTLPASRYVVVRCSDCGNIYDYDATQIVVGLED